ncbi:MAG TPA: UDP-N-acetylglucosamine diphosphorylase/glucosamine-1-phosphate N-acetyltransferase, partial [Thiothrix sp.]|nr:UDP-N-acetylglucosamine diphosphorylase/glucosamine-1-phosphate N-acetyltransferase [Thiothrix sp.]
MKRLPIILAAGKGTRMRSQLPKVLHPVGGKAMLQHVVDRCASVADEQLVIIYGHAGEQVQTAIQQPTDKTVQWVEQTEQKGTGHAVAQAQALIDDDDYVIIANGDVPLIQTETLNALANGLAHAELCVLTTILDNPKGYGRIVREGGQVTQIVEEKDASDEIRHIKEINTGFIAARGQALKRWLQQLNPNNAQGEYYLTDCMGLAVAEGRRVTAVVCADSREVEGVNNHVQQARVERYYQQQQLNALMMAGLTVYDPARVDIRGELSIGQDVVVDVNVVFMGRVTLGNHVQIESGGMLKDCQIVDHVTIKAHSVLEGATVANHCDIGPFARLRPNTVLENHVKIGNFVETKKSQIGVGSKVNHLSYIGDTQMGADVNIGAGTITCNYDGANK